MSNFMLLILFGGLLGFIGQGIRIAVGIKKLNAQAASEQKEFNELFSTQKILISLLIGFVAGSLASFSLDENTTTLDKQLALGLIAAGYSGADFIEGFMNSFLKKK